MEILFLGTSSGVPTKARNVSAIALKESQGSKWYLIDCGEGTQHQILKTKLSLNSLNTIFITHVHGDHCYGLPGLLASAGMSGRKEPLKIAAPKGIREWLEFTQEQTKFYLPYKLEFITMEELDDKKFGEYRISVAELSHRVPSYAFGFTESEVEPRLDIDKLKSENIPQGPVWGKLKKGIDVEYNSKILLSSDYIKQPRKPIKAVICGDNDNPKLLMHECRDCNVLVHEATYTEDIAKKTDDVGHSYANLVAEFAQSALIPNLILTHFSPRYNLDPKADLSIEFLRAEAKKSYFGNLFLAEDFNRYELNKSGELKIANND